jgi:restriction system protein
MYGLMHHHSAHALAIVTSGTFTETARQFAHGKPIELIDGTKLTRMLRPPHPLTARAARTMGSTNKENET